MATRFYFPASTAADVSPAFNVSGWFTATGSAVRRKMVTTKGASAIAIGSTISFAATGYGLDRQYVSAPLAAQTILGTSVAKMQLMTREFATSDNVDYVVVSLHIFSNDGSTLKYTLLNFAGYGTVGTEFINNATCRNCTCITNIWDFLSNGDGGDGSGDYPVDDGDRLVLEIGYGCNTGVGTTPQAAAKWGENATDLPENDTQTTDGAGWFEIDQTLTFSGTSHALSGAAAVAVSSAGNAVRVATMSGSAAVAVSASSPAMNLTQAMSGTAAVVCSASGALYLTQAISGSAAVAVSSAGNLTRIQQLAGSAAVAVSADGNASRVLGLSGSAGVAVASAGAITAVIGLAGGASVAVSVSGNLVRVTPVPQINHTLAVAGFDDSDVVVEHGIVVRAAVFTKDVYSASSVSGRFVTVPVNAGN